MLESLLPLKLPSLHLWGVKKALSVRRAKVSLSVLLIIVISFLPVLPSFGSLNLSGVLTTKAALVTWGGGGVNELWSNPANWSEGVVPTEGDVVVFDSTNTKDVRVDTDIHVAGIEIKAGYTGQIGMAPTATVTVGQEGFHQAGGRFVGRSGAVASAGSLEVMAGEFVAPDSTLSIKGNVFVLDSTSFKHNRGTVILDGPVQTMFGSTTFHNLRKVAGVPQILQLQSGKQITVEGSLTLAGAPATPGGLADENQLAVEASKPGEPAIIDPQGQTDIAHLAIRDIITTSSHPVRCALGCTQSGNSSGWEIPPTPEGVPGETVTSDLTNQLGAVTSRIRNTAQRVFGRSKIAVPTPGPQTRLVIGDVPEGATEDLVAKASADFTADETVVFAIKVDQSAKAAELSPLAEESIPVVVLPEGSPLPSEAPASTTGVSPSASSVEAAGEKTSWLDRFWQNFTAVPVAVAAVEPPAAAEVGVVVFDPLGSTAAIVPTLETTTDGQLLVRAEKPDGPFRPGKYTLKLTVGGSEYIQDFTWGVLALNMDRSTYRVNEPVALAMTALDDLGFTVCDANLVLDIIAPGGSTTQLRTNTSLVPNDQAILRSSECGPRTVTNVPDYAATYHPNQLGEYQVQLTAETANGQRTMERSFTVVDSAPFVTTRAITTRIFPPVAYEAQITITASEAFTGELVEYVPGSFAITNATMVLRPASGGQASAPERAPLTIHAADDQKALLTPSLTLKPGDTVQITYTFDAPDISPEFYLLGPLTLFSDEPLLPSNPTPTPSTQPTVSPTPSGLGGPTDADTSVADSPASVTPSDSPGAADGTEVTPEPTPTAAGTTAPLPETSPSPVPSPTATSSISEQINADADATPTPTLLPSPSADQADVTASPEPSPSPVPEPSPSPIIPPSDGTPPTAAADYSILWSEPRAWQIASDATFNDAATGNWNIGTTWGGACSSSCTEGTDYPGASDDVTINSHTVTVSANQSVHDLTLATGGTLDGSSNTLRVAGSWTNTGGTFTESTSTVHFTPSDKEVITANGDNWNNVTINDGLVGYWKFDEGTGISTTADSSGYGNTGTMTNLDEVDWTATPGTTNFTNPFSLDFDGSNEYVSVADAAVLDVTDTADLTISGWFNRDTFDTGDIMLAKRNGNAATDTGYYVGITGADVLIFEVADGTDEYSLTSTTTFTGTGWNHFAVVWDQDSAANSEIYINGVDDNATDAGTIANVGDLSNALSLVLGAESDVGNPFDGKLDDMRLYKRALTPQEIQSLAVGNQPATALDTSNLVGYWKFDDGAGTSAIDSAGNGTTGTLTNMEEADWDATTKATLDFTNGYSLDFDGSDEYVTAGDVAAVDVAKELTFCAWVRHDTLTTDDAMIIKADAATNGVKLFRDDAASVSGRTDTYQWVARDSADTDIARIEGATNASPSATWTHVCGTYVASSSTGLRLYVNGIEDANSPVSTSSIAAIDGGTNALTIGMESDGTSDPFDGHIDDVRVYDRALAADEIAALGSGSRPGTIQLEDTLNVDGNLLLNTGYLDTKDAEDNAISVAGTYENNGGIHQFNQNTFTLDGTATGKELQSGGQSFYNLTASGSGGGWTLHDRLEVTNTYAQSNGTVDTSSNSYAITANDWDQTGGTFTDNASTLTLNSSAAQTVNFDDAVNDLQIEDPTEANLVGYWKLDEGQSLIAADSSGNANHGTLQNTPIWYETVNSTTTYDNPFALDFDGSNDYVAVADAATLDFGDTADLTISGWFNRDTFTTDDTIIAKRNGIAAGDQGYIAYIDDTTDQLIFEVSDATDEYSLASASTFTATGWNHFAVVWDQDSAANSEVYINGVDDNATDAGTIANVGDLSNTLSLVLGAESDVGNPFDGKLDDVRMYSSALTAAQAAALAAGKYADGDNGTATFTLNTALDVDDDLFIQSGVLDVSAANCASASCGMMLAGDWNNFAGTSGFTARTGTVTLDGTAQTIKGATTWYNLTKNEGVNDATDETLTFEASTTFTISNLLRLVGRDSNDRINILSTAAGTKATLDVTGGQQVVYYLDVKDSQASTRDIICQNCVNSGGNDDAEASPHWVFGSGAGDGGGGRKRLFVDE